MPNPINVQVGLPSGRSISNWIKNTTTVEVKLMTNDVLVGQLRWQDDECIGLGENGGSMTLIWRSAIAYIRPRG